MSCQHCHKELATQHVNIDDGDPVWMCDGCVQKVVDAGKVVLACGGMLSSLQAGKLVKKLGGAANETLLTAEQVGQLFSLPKWGELEHTIPVRTYVDAKGRTRRVLLGHGPMKIDEVYIGDEKLTDLCDHEFVGNGKTGMYGDTVLECENCGIEKYEEVVELWEARKRVKEALKATPAWERFVKSLKEVLPWLSK